MSFVLFALLAWFLIGLGVALVVGRAIAIGEAEYEETVVGDGKRSELAVAAEARTLNRLDALRSPSGRPFFLRRADRKRLALALFDFPLRGRALR
jgi:hypothetical protein